MYGVEDNTTYYRKVSNSRRLSVYTSPLGDDGGVHSVRPVSDIFSRPSLVRCFHGQPSMTADMLQAAGDDITTGDTPGTTLPKIQFEVEIRSEFFPV